MPLALPLFLFLTALQPTTPPTKRRKIGSSHHAQDVDVSGAMASV